MIHATNLRRIGLLGLSFKAGTDDLRESPIVSLAEQLIGKGYELAIYDRNVKLASLVGANRDYILHHIPHIGRLAGRCTAGALRSVGRDRPGDCGEGVRRPRLAPLGGESCDRPGRIVGADHSLRGVGAMKSYDGIAW